MFKAERLIKRENSPSEMDSVKVRQSKLRTKDKDIALLGRCRTIWYNMYEYRQQRARGHRFYDGDQWADMITVNGKTMTYRDYLMSTGNVVIQTNQIKNRVDTIAGVMVKERSEPVCHAIDRDEQPYGEIVTEALQANCNKNVMQELYMKWVKEVCIGGLAVSYESYDDHSGPNRRLDSWTQYINPNTVFMDGEGVDPRFWDFSIVGRFYYGAFENICAQFARKPSDFDLLRTVYSNQSDPFREEESREFSDKFEDGDLQFMRSDDPTRCYVCEVWTKETKARIRLHDTNAGTEEIIDADDYAYRKEVKSENMRRKKLAQMSGFGDGEIPYIIGDGYGKDESERNGFFMDTFWYCRYLAPDGTILWEGESPYADRSHPFCFCIFPYIDGKIVGYMNDAIDHNIAINRAIVLHDWLLRTQAKGVTVVPKAIVPKDVKFSEFARSWTSIDDMVFIDMKPGQEGLMPKTFFGAAQNFDVGSLISTYSRLMENGSPVNGALQGKTPGSGVSGTLYAQMTTNASTPIASLMEQFHHFIETVLTKKMKNIVMFYDEERFRSISGSIDSIFDYSKLNLNDVADIEYDLRVRESSDTPVFREMQEQDLLMFLQAGFITFDEYLEASSKPYVDKIMQKRQARQAEMDAAQQLPQGGAPVGEPSPEVNQWNEGQPQPRLPKPLVSPTGDAL